MWGILKSLVKSQTLQTLGNKTLSLIKSMSHVKNWSQKKIHMHKNRSWNSPILVLKWISCFVFNLLLISMECTYICFHCCLMIVLRVEIVWTSPPISNFYKKIHPLYGYPLFRYELKIKSEIKVQRAGDFMDNSITWTLYKLCFYVETHFEHSTKMSCHSQLTKSDTWHDANK